jgi:hypothetical protein
LMKQSQHQGYGKVLKGMYGKLLFFEFALFDFFPIFTL